MTEKEKLRHLKSNPKEEDYLKVIGKGLNTESIKPLKDIKIGDESLGKVIKDIDSDLIKIINDFILFKKEFNELKEIVELIVEGLKNR